MSSLLHRSWDILSQHLPKASPPIFILFFLLTTPQLQAIHDTNQNGVSDLWEEKFNSGQLYSNFIPTADPDGDGWTNSQEAAAGTDPGSGVPPIGILNPTVTYTPTVYLSSAQPGGEPEILTPEAATITWPTVAGKKYTLLFSPDLESGTWIQIGSPRIGEGTEIGTSIALTQPDGSTPPRGFWRVTINDEDTDSDTLTNAEEHELGSNPNLTDTDGDGLSDVDELFVYQTNPSSPDTDGDTLKDGEDADPTSSVINWTVGPAPKFAIIELAGEAFSDSSEIFGYSLTDKGTIFLYNSKAPQTSKGIAVNAEGRVVSFNVGNGWWSGEGFAATSNVLIDEKIFGQRTIHQEKCLWDPFTNIYTPLAWANSHNPGTFGFCNHRHGVTVWIRRGPSLSESYGVRTSIDGSLLPGVQALNSGGTQESHRNILGSRAYWRWNATTNGYNQPIDLPQNTQAYTSATVQRVNSQTGAIKKWNLATTDLGLAVAEDDGAFQIATGSFGNFHEVTEQGWFFRQNSANESQVWVKGKWTNLYELLGDGITSAKILKIIDTGHMVARLRRGQDPYFIARLLPVDIKPDANMAGVVGDVVKSAKAGSTVEHFVTPKKSTELNQDYVELKAVGVDTATFSKLLEWEGGEAGSTADKRKVKRDTAGKTEVKIKVKQGGAVAAQMNVWVTWATLKNLEGPETRIPSVELVEGMPGVKFRARVKWEYECEPRSMFVAREEVPLLAIPPGIPAPGGRHPWTAQPLSEGANMCYDASRQVRVVTRSNDLTLNQALQNGGPDVIDYPASSVEGNDDPNTDRERDPFGVYSGIMEDADFPEFPLKDSTASSNPNAKILSVAQFKQFARFQVGGRWYKCSAESEGLSTLTFKLKRTNAKWVDDGSTYILGNGVFPPP